MGKIDKTKENIGVDNLDESSRKHLFDKFVSSGGKVIEDKEKKKHLIIDRKKQKEFQKKQAEKNKRNKQYSQKGEQTSSQTGKSKISKHEEDSVTLFFQKIKLKFLLKFNRITNFSGTFFNNSFLEKFNNTYKPALMEIQIIYMDLFKQDWETSKQMIQALDKIKPIYYELIELSGYLYEKATIDKIVEHYVNYSNVPKKVSELKENILQIYRKIYILKPYENVLLFSFEKAIENHIKISGKKTSLHSASKKNIRNLLFTIFHKLYPRLHLLFCKYANGYYDEFDQRIAQFLNIKDTDKPGNRKAMTLEEKAPIEEKEIDIKDEEENEKSEEEKKVANAEKKGFEVMYQLDMNMLRTEYDKAGLFNLTGDADKTLLTYLLFREFDKEYSFILTTNKIQYKKEYDMNPEYDFHDKLKNLYDEMRKPLSAIQNFSKIVTLLVKAKKEKPKDNTQYINHTKNIEAILTKKNEIANVIRLYIKQFMENLSVILKVLLDDMEKDQRFIMNPQEEIKFDAHIEGNKKLNSKKIYEAIYITYSYSLAFIKRLSPGGDLFISKKEKDESQEAPVETETAVEDPEKAKSILDELDDLV